MFLSSKLKKARIEKKLTQKELAQMLSENGCNTTLATVSNWELDKSRPDIDTLALIAKLLNKDGNYFFQEENDKYLSYNTDGLDEKDIEEIERFIEFLKNKKKKN